MFQGRGGSDALQAASRVQREAADFDSQLAKLEVSEDNRRRLERFLDSLPAYLKILSISDISNASSAEKQLFFNYLSAEPDALLVTVSNWPGRFCKLLPMWDRMRRLEAAASLAKVEGALKRCRFAEECFDGFFPHALRMLEQNPRIAAFILEQAKDSLQARELFECYWKECGVIVDAIAAASSKNTFKLSMAFSRAEDVAKIAPGIALLSAVCGELNIQLGEVLISDSSKPYLTRFIGFTIELTKLEGEWPRTLLTHLLQPILARREDEVLRAFSYVSNSSLRERLIPLVSGPKFIEAPERALALLERWGDFAVGVFESQGQAIPDFTIGELLVLEQLSKHGAAAGDMLAVLPRCFWTTHALSLFDRFEEGARDILATNCTEPFLDRLLRPTGIFADLKTELGVVCVMRYGEGALGRIDLSFLRANLRRSRQKAPAGKKTVVVMTSRQDHNGALNIGGARDFYDKLLKDCHVIFVEFGGLDRIHEGFARLSSIHADASDGRFMDALIWNAHMRPGSISHGKRPLESRDIVDIDSWRPFFKPGAQLFLSGCRSAVSESENDAVALSVARALPEVVVVGSMGEISHTTYILDKTSDRIVSKHIGVGKSYGREVTSKIISGSSINDSKF